MRLLSFLLALLPFTDALALELPHIFTDHMVLQREMPVPVWGTAEAGESITVEFAGQRVTTTADTAGQWRVDLAPLPASDEPRDLVVTSANPHSADLKSEISNLRFSDVLVGEVWLASGQSNMVFTVSKSAYPWAGVIDEAAEIAAADHPLVRIFTGEPQKAYTPCADVGGRWQVCSPETVPAFSAIAYFFARDLQRELGVPVGILSLSYGASCAQAWIRRDAMLGDDDFRAVLARFDEQVKGHVPPTAAELEDWKAAAELAKAEHRRAPPKPGADPVQDQHNPTVLYNGMIAPVVPYSLRGVIWYQGESITSPRELFPRWNELLITDWRRLWGRELPFLFCQLAALDKPSNSPEVRAWQAEALALPATGMAVTIDVGDPKDVHPHHKAPVGARLMRLALAKAYGRPVEFSGPVPTTAIVEADALRLHFACSTVAQASLPAIPDSASSPTPPSTAGTEAGATPHPARSTVAQASLPASLGSASSPTPPSTAATGGLVARGGPLATFELAGADGVFMPATATIEGDTIVVRSAAIAQPTAVRYAWSNYPAGCNLYNTAGLPAAPFSLTAAP